MICLLKINKSLYKNLILKNIMYKCQTNDSGTISIYLGNLATQSTSIDVMYLNENNWKSFLAWQTGLLLLSLINDKVSKAHLNKLIDKFHEIKDNETEENLKSSIKKSQKLIDNHYKTGSELSKLLSTDEKVRTEAWLENFGTRDSRLKFDVELHDLELPENYNL